MKSLHLFLMLVCSGSLSLAQPGTISILKLRLSDQSAIAVNLDGRFIDRGTTTLTLDGIRPGLHRIEVYSDNGRRRPVRVFSGTLRLRSGMVHIGMVDVFNRGLSLRTRPIDDRNGGYSDQSRRPGYQEQNDRIDTREYRFDNNPSTDKEQRTADEVYSDQYVLKDNKSEGYGSFPKGRSNKSSPLPNAISQHDLDELQSKASSLITDSDKEQLMKRALDGRSIYTDQVRQMLNWLAFETSRLEFAKWVFPKVIDLANYWKLDDVFEFNSSKEEFRKATRQN